MVQCTECQFDVSVFILLVTQVRRIVSAYAIIDVINVEMKIKNVKKVKKVEKIKTPL